MPTSISVCLLELEGEAMILSTGLIERRQDICFNNRLLDYIRCKPAQDLTSHSSHAHDVSDAFQQHQTAKARFIRRRNDFRCEPIIYVVHRRRNHACMLALLYSVTGRCTRHEPAVLENPPAPTMQQYQLFVNIKDGLEMRKAKMCCFAASYGMRCARWLDATQSWISTQPRC